MADAPKSTGAYPTPPTPKYVPQGDDGTDWAASTMVYPAGPVTPLNVVDAIYDGDGMPIDFSRSTGAFPMYDSPAEALLVGAALTAPAPAARPERTRTRTRKGSA